MSYSQMIELLKLKHKGKLLLVKTGAFYVATAEDAIFLHDTIGLKCTCFKNYVCKVGVPEKTLNKYIDRIVHRWVVDNFLEPYFVTTFISTSYACIKGRGMHKAVKRVQKDMLHLTRAWKEYYIIKMDIKKYFENIDKDILYKILNRKIKDKKLRWLIKEILYSNGGKTGLAIGNYTSQVFANIYLNEVDQYVKHKLKQKYYYRYMDDSVIFVKSKQEAKETLENIRNFLEEELRLTLKQKIQIFKNKQGVNFCGYKIKEYRLKIRDRGKRKLKKKIKYLTQEIKEGRMTSKEAKKYLCGHIGYIKMANVYHFTQKIFGTD